MNDEPRASSKQELIERTIDRGTAGALDVSTSVGGVSFKNMLEVMEFAKLMAVSRQAVPQHLRDNPGMCLAVSIQASEWNLSPFAVAGKSYVVNDRIAWESQLIHAVIEARAPLMERLKTRYTGEGQEMVCTVYAKVRGEVDPLEWDSPKLKDIKVQNSPLWKADQKLQLFYYTSRSWARRWFPDVIMGIYSRDEMAAVGPEGARDITPAGPGNGHPVGANTLTERLASADHGDEAEGLKPGDVENGLKEADGNGKEAATTGEAGHDPETGEVNEQASQPEQTGGKTKPKAKAKKKTAAEPKAETKPEPKPAEAEPEKPTAAEPKKAEPVKEGEPEKAPTNVIEYAQYVVAWVQRYDEEEALEARWVAERKLRNQCGVTSDERTGIRKAIDNRIAEFSAK